MAVAAKPTEQTTNLVQVNVHEIMVPIVGTAPLIVQRFGFKARNSIQAGQSGAAKVKKAPRDPDYDFQDARHLLPDGSDGFPAVGFKAAIIGGARVLESAVMTRLKQGVFLYGEGPDNLVRIESEPPEMRTDYVRIGKGTTDLRYRPQYWPWSATLHIQYIEQLVNLENLLALIQAGGFGGIGEWRPSSKMSMTGSYGTFELDKSRDLVSLS